jgi:hypothetical protein
MGLRVALVALVALAGCVSAPEREWMKINERYTVADFRRDHAECSHKGKLDEACMRSRGWVDVKRPAEKSPDVSEGPRR